MKFKEYKGLDLPGLAADVLKEWDAQDTFHKSISTREGHPTFVFYEGPPLSQRHAGHPSRHGPHDQGYLLPLQDAARLPRSPQGRMGHARTACRVRRRKETRHHQGGHRAHNLHRGVQPRLPRGGDGVHGACGKNSRAKWVIGSIWTTPTSLTTTNTSKPSGGF